MNAFIAVLLKVFFLVLQDFSQNFVWYSPFNDITTHQPFPSGKFLAHNSKQLYTNINIYQYNYFPQSPRYTVFWIFGKPHWFDKFPQCTQTFVQKNASGNTDKYIPLFVRKDPACGTARSGSGCTTRRKRRRRKRRRRRRRRRRGSGRASPGPSPPPHAAERCPPPPCWPPAAVLHPSRRGGGTIFSRRSFLRWCCGATDRTQPPYEGTCRDPTCHLHFPPSIYSLIILIIYSSRGFQWFATRQKAKKCEWNVVPKDN